MIVPALAGPFDLGVVVIRQALYIDPTDAHVTDVSDPFPTIRDGIPLRIQRVNVNLDRPNFTLNPTSCETKTITAHRDQHDGHARRALEPLPGRGLREPAVRPEADRVGGGKRAESTVRASREARLRGHRAGQHRKVDLTIPVALPSRLSTLQKACLAASSTSNPACCP